MTPSTWVLQWAVSLWSSSTGIRQVALTDITARKKAAAESSDL